LDVKQIKAVLAVAEHLSFSMAAVELSFTTSAISKQIIALEKELEVRLFERHSSSKVTLTTEGKKLLPFFCEIQKNFEIICESIIELKNQEEPALNFSYPIGPSNFGEDRFISAFYNKYPGITVKQHSAVGTDLIKKMAIGKIDACVFMNINNLFEHILAETQFDPNMFTCISLGKSKLLLAISAAHPLAKTKSVNLEDFKNEKFLFKKYFPKMEESHGIKSFIEECRKLGFDPEITITGEQKTSLIFLEAAKGNVVIPLLSPPNVDYKGVAVVSVKNIEPYAEKQIYYLKDNKSPTLAKFIKCVKELIDKDNTKN